MRYSAKRFADPVHGTIGLSDVEVEITRTDSFQRLHHVRHLGLAYLVYPTATFSRFSHCLGVCHATGLLLRNLIRNKTSIEERELQLYRLAALLHDIGHYPFSHVMERAIHDYYSGMLIKPKTEVEEVGKTTEVDDDKMFFEHERVGREVLEKDAQIKKVFDKHGFEPREVFSIFSRQEPPRFANLIRSDLDADRIDYLLRTAQHTGLPYGSIDANYLLSQVCTDSKNRICFTSKALRTADHLLLGRYFDYQQVSFHKTNAGLELVLKDVISGLLDRKKIDCSAEWISRAIESGKWSHFDDARILHEIAKLAEDEETDPIVKLKADAILHRRPPKVVAEIEYLEQLEKKRTEQFLTLKQIVNEKVNDWAKTFGIDRSLWYIWHQVGIKITTIGSHVPISAIEEERTGNEKDKFQQSVRILNSQGDSSKPIVELDSSLMSILSNYGLYYIRIYILFPEEKQGLRDKIEKEVKEQLPHFPWR